MSVWFTSPIKNNPNMKMGKECETLIASKIPSFFNNGGSNKIKASQKSD